MSIKQEIDWSRHIPPAGTAITTMHDLDRFFKDRDNKQYVEATMYGMDVKCNIRYINLSGLYCHVSEDFVRNYYLQHWSRKYCPYVYSFERVPSISGVYKVTAAHKGK